MAESVKEHALIHNPDALVYKNLCGREAEFKVGDWYVCKKHKEYYTDPKGWAAIPLESEEKYD